MPLPLVLIPIVVAAGALFTGAIWLKWDELIILFKGKKFAVLGEREVGKTTLINFLKGGATSDSSPGYTQYSEPVPARRFQLKELDIILKESWDISGSVKRYAEWKTLCQDADMVLYLLRADRLLLGDKTVETRVIQDIRHVSEWLNDNKKRPQFFIVGTHCDLDPDFVALTPKTEGKYLDKFERLPIVVDIVSRIGSPNRPVIVLGSLKTPEQAETLVHTLFKIASHQ